MKEGSSRNSQKRKLGRERLRKRAKKVKKQNRSNLGRKSREDM